jgi:DNA ligase (NAD+)
VPLDRFLAGLNVAEFSRQRAQMLIDAGYDTLDAILALEADDIAAVKGFAEKLAEKVHSGLAARRERIERLLAGGVEVVSPPRTAADAAAGGGPFAGKTVCFTGAVGEENPATGKRWTRKELEDLVVAHGGKPRSDVSGNLDFLVMADPSSKSSKAQKARKLGIEILSEKDFFARLESAT